MDNNQQQNDKQQPEIGADAGNNEKIDRPSTEVKSITNIYYDCLERIYDFLDLESLLNVAGTCKRLQIAAAAFFGDVHGKKTVQLCVMDNNWFEPGIRLIEPDFIGVNVLKFCLPFLRCFGAKIEHLDLEYFYNKREPEHNVYIDRYINQYCAKTLKAISFNISSELYIENFPNPFECVEDVFFGGVNLGVHLPYLCHLFPKLRNLKMHDVSIDENCADIRLPNLEKLLIWIGPEGSFTMNGITKHLRSNPQLQDLKLFFGQEVAWDKLFDTINGNPSITKLMMKSSNSTNINQVDLLRFANEHASIVELKFWNHRIAPQDAIVFIGQLKSLKKFTFQINNQAEFNELVSHLDSKWKHEYTIHDGFNELAITLTR